MCVIMKTVTAVLAAVVMQAVVFAGEPVKYRGIFINDEDWGLRPWANRHFQDRKSTRLNSSH